ncbi:MAG: hypothetical protein MZV70_41995 [Desulfobacterales bacterium]|nr:hypothetical protein [Desulfobacterales bacterium]
MRRGFREGMSMRIITRADFDGIVCAVLLGDALNIQKPVSGLNPTTYKTNESPYFSGDIIANAFLSMKTVPYGLIITNPTVFKEPFNGVFKAAPSAASNDTRPFKISIKSNRVIPGLFLFSEAIPARFYRTGGSRRWKIDSAHLSPKEVIQPSRIICGFVNDHISHARNDEPYWNRLITFLQNTDIETIIQDPEIQTRHCLQRKKKIKRIPIFKSVHGHEGKHLNHRFPFPQSDAFRKPIFGFFTFSAVCDQCQDPLS